MALPACDTWSCINSFAPWLAAIGTVGTLIGTLVIATRDRRPRVRMQSNVLFTGAPIVLGPSGTATVNTRDFTPFFEVQVVNIGQCPVIIDNCGWLVRLNRRQHLLLKSNRSASPLANDMQTTLPCTLKYGERARFVFDTFTLPGPDNELHGTQLRWLAWLRTRSLKFQLMTSIGKGIRIGADSEIKRSVWATYCAKHYGAKAG